MTAKGAGTPDAFLRLVAYVRDAFGAAFRVTRGYTAAHDGIDLAAPKGTPVRALASGRVTYARNAAGDARAGAAWAIGGGNVVNVDIGGSKITQYAHLDRISVKPGTYVQRGQVIGTVGATGNATGPHLHFGLLDTKARRMIDPTSFLASVRQSITLDVFMRAIAQVESGGSYTARNTSTGAYGKYQILPSNWGPWAVKAGLPANAPQTPENQERVARAAFERLAKSYDNDWPRVAAAWHAGVAGTAGGPGTGNWGPRTTAYVEKVMGILGTSGPGSMLGAWNDIVKFPVGHVLTESDVDAMISQLRDAGYFKVEGGDGIGSVIGEQVARDTLMRYVGRSWGKPLQDEIQGAFQTRATEAGGLAAGVGSIAGSLGAIVGALLDPRKWLLFLALIAGAAMTAFGGISLARSAA